MQVCGKFVFKIILFLCKSGPFASGVPRLISDLSGYPLFWAVPNEKINFCQLICLLLTCLCAIVDGAGVNNNKNKG